jgi:hypothetical protein
MLTAAAPDLKDILATCYGNTGVFCKTLLPEAFPTPWSQLHYKIIRAIDSGHQKIAIAAPRGLGKTSLARALVEKSILYRDYEFIPYISNGETVATMQTENIKRELLSNREIRRIFGNIHISEDDPEIDESFSKQSWVAFGNTLVMPRGAGQQVRGLLYRNSRPQLIVVDDLEKKEELENPENRRKLKEWFHSDLMKCVDRYSNKWRILYIDTLKHYDSLLQDLLSDPEWYSLRLDLCDDNYNSLAPHLISTEELKREVESHRSKGILDIFYMEYRNMPIAKEDASFRQEHFKYYDEIDLDKKNLENYVIVDPAKTVNMHSADSAIVGIGVNFATSAIYIRDIVSDKFFPNELYDEMFAMRRRLNAHRVGIEVTGLEEFIKQPIQNEMLKRGPADAFEPIWLKARGGSPDGEKGKIKRIGSLSPYYRNGYIFHNRSNCAKLEAQLLSFPRSGLVDVADAEAYIIELLELGGRYFSTPEDSYPEPTGDDEYAELEYELPTTTIRRI